MWCQGRTRDTTNDSDNSHWSRESRRYYCFSRLEHSRRRGSSTIAPEADQNAGQHRSPLATPSLSLSKRVHTRGTELKRDQIHDWRPCEGKNERRLETVESLIVGQFKGYRQLNGYVQFCSREIVCRGWWRVDDGSSGKG